MTYQARLMDAHKVLCLLLVRDIINKRLLESEEFMKKANAFEETMDYYKDIRREKELHW